MICIIPARGGSTRLPGKNIKLLDGVPVLNRVINIVEESGLFTDIIVSTDSDEVRNIVDNRCNVMMRPARLSGDVPEENVLFDVISQFRTEEFCKVYPFAALLTPERLRKGFLEYKSGTFDSVMECQKYGHPIMRAIDGNIMQWIHPDYVSLPTQDLPISYHDAGTFVFTSTNGIIKPLSKRNIKWLPVDEWEAQDIDDGNDWEMLEMKWRYHNGML